jgi:Cu/Ag efflux pump CusA
VRVLKRVYGAALWRVIRRPAAAFGAAAVLALAGLAVAPGLGENLYPAFKERNFLMHWITPPGTSDTEERRIVTQASREMRQIPGVRNFGSHIGQAFLAEEIAGSNFGENWVSIDKNADYDKTLSALEDSVDGHPGLYHDVQTYLRERIDEVLAGAAEPIVVRVFGPDLHVLRREAAKVRKALSGTDGLDDLHTELAADVPEIKVRVKLGVAERYGLKPGDVRRASAALLASEEVGDIFNGARAYDVHVWSTTGTRHSLSDVRNLPIDTPAGGHVRLADVASVQVRPTPNVIHRQDSSRRIDIAANAASDRSLNETVSDVRNRLDEVEFSEGYHAELLGEAVEQEGAQDRLMIFGIAAAIGIFLLLQAAFRSWRLATLAFLTLPLALVGGELAGLINGGSFSLGALAGLLAVLAIALRNGVVQITHYQRLEEHEGETLGPDLVMKGSGERLAPVLTTGGATAVAMLPFVVLGDRAGLEIVHPMAVVVLGGLVTATLLSLFVVPALYLRFAPSGAPERSHEDDLLHRWAGVEPEQATAVAREPAAVDPDPIPEQDGSTSGTEVKEEA